VSLQCCLRLKPILKERYEQEIEKYEDPNEHHDANEEKEAKIAFRNYKQALKDNIRRVETQLDHHVIEQKSVQLILDSEFWMGWIYKDLHKFIMSLFSNLQNQEYFGLMNLDVDI